MFQMLLKLWPRPAHGRLANEYLDALASSDKAEIGNAQAPSLRKGDLRLAYPDQLAHLALGEILGKRLRFRVIRMWRLMVIAALRSGWVGAKDSRQSFRKWLISTAMRPARLIYAAQDSLRNPSTGLVAAAHKFVDTRFPGMILLV